MINCMKNYLQLELMTRLIEIWNPGSLPPGLTPEILFHEHDSIPRNRRIADAFFFSGLIERWGSGTLRIAEELAAAGLPSPQFVKELLTSDYLKKLNLSKRQLDAIAYVKEHGSISNSEYQTIASVSKRTATRELNLLKEKDIFEPKGVTGRGTVYKLKGAKGAIKAEKSTHIFLFFIA